MPFDSGVVNLHSMYTRSYTPRWGCSVHWLRCPKGPRKFPVISEIFQAFYCVYKMEKERSRKKIQDEVDPGGPVCNI